MARFKHGDPVVWGDSNSVYVYGCIDPTDKTRELVVAPEVVEEDHRTARAYAWTAPLAELTKAGA